MFTTLIALSAMQAAYPRAPMRLTPFPQLISTRYTASNGLPAAATTEVRLIGNNVMAFAGGKWTKLKGNRWIDLQDTDPTPASLAYPFARPGFEPRVLSAAQTRSREMIYVTTA